MMQLNSRSTCQPFPRAAPARKRTLTGTIALSEVQKRELLAAAEAPEKVHHVTDPRTAQALERVGFGKYQGLEWRVGHRFLINENGVRAAAVLAASGGS